MLLSCVCQLRRRSDKQDPQLDPHRTGCFPSASLSVTLSWHGLSRSKPAGPRLLRWQVMARERWLVWLRAVGLPMDAEPEGCMRGPRPTTGKGDQAWAPPGLVAELGKVSSVHPAALPSHARAVPPCSTKGLGTQIKMTGLRRRGGSRLFGRDLCYRPAAAAWGGSLLPPASAHLLGPSSWRPSPVGLLPASPRMGVGRLTEFRACLCACRARAQFQTLGAQMDSHNPALRVPAAGGARQARERQWAGASRKRHLGRDGAHLP